MYLDRQQLIEEIRLRDFVKRAIKVRAKNKVKPQIWEEFEIRSIVRKLLKEAPAEKAQHRSTGINVLEDLLKKIIPVIETDYKMLTTDSEQRKSFAAHIVSAVQNALAPITVTSAAGEEKFISVDEIDDINEIEVEVAYALLSNEEDQSLFEEYLLTNIKLYFDKFEDELSATLVEPTTPEYEEEKDGEEESDEEELEL